MKWTQRELRILLLGSLWIGLFDMLAIYAIYFWFLFGG